MSTGMRPLWRISSTASRYFSRNSFGGVLQSKCSSGCREMAAQSKSQSLPPISSTAISSSGAAAPLSRRIRGRIFRMVQPKRAQLRMVNWNISPSFCSQSRLTTYLPPSSSTPFRMESP